jgi:YesN/AraC family two-component response regulator
MADLITQKIIIKNMNCHCCLKLAERIFKENDIELLSINLGEAKISYNPEKITDDDLTRILEAEGFELIQNKEKQLIEKIKSAVINMVHHTTFNAMVRNSDYLVEKFDLSYQYMSSIFSKNEDMTLEKFIIIQKIEKAKELIHYGELNLSEIAYMMGYSSVQYLSTQFKTITGISVSEFKKNPGAYRKSVGDL